MWYDGICETLPGGTDVCPQGSCSWEMDRCVHPIGAAGMPPWAYYVKGGPIGGVIGAVIGIVIGYKLGADE